jgi:hypothetical protein
VGDNVHRFPRKMPASAGAPAMGSGSALFQEILGAVGADKDWDAMKSFVALVAFLDSVSPPGTKQAAERDQGLFLAVQELHDDEVRQALAGWTESGAGLKPKYYYLIAKEFMKRFG